MKPFVAIGVIEVPVRVDEVRDGVIAELASSALLIWDRDTLNACIDEDFAVRAGQDGDIAAGSLERADTVPQLVV